MPYTEPFIGKILAFIALLLLITWIFSYILRKVLNVERQRLFSNNYLSDSHKKGDRMIRTINAVVSFAIIIAGVTDFIPYHVFTVYFGVTVVVFIIIEFLFKSYMEWKIKKGKNDYIYTLIQMIFMVAVFYFALETKGFGILSF